MSLHYEYLGGSECLFPAPHSGGLGIRQGQQDPLEKSRSECCWENMLVTVHGR